MGWLGCLSLGLLNFAHSVKLMVDPPEKTYLLREMSSVSVKEDIITMIENLPDNTDYDDIMYHIYVRQKVDKGCAQLANGEGIDHVDVKKSLSKWLPE